MIKVHFPENVNTITAEFSASFNDLHTEALRLKPPTHAWSGPQPGLLQQTDEEHRYTFSEHTGRLEYVVKYAESGLPRMRVRYKHSAASGGHAFPVEVDIWKNGEYISTGEIPYVQLPTAPHQIPLYMVTAEGDEREIPHNNPKIFITPAGSVVLLVREGGLIRRPLSEYQGRVSGFNPLRPFLMKTTYGLLPLQPERTDVLIDPKGNVYQLTTSGMRCIGVLAEDVQNENAIPEKAPAFTASNHFFTVRLYPDEPAATKYAVQLQHQGITRAVDGPLHTIVGKHAFMHPHVPELVDMHGSVAAEEKLRGVERHAIELGLVLNTLRTEQRPDARAALLRLQYLMEERLWIEIAALEDVVGMERHTLIHPPSIRLWLERAAENPLAAVADLKHLATPRYATR